MLAIIIKNVVLSYLKLLFLLIYFKFKLKLQVIQFISQFILFSFHLLHFLFPFTYLFPNLFHYPFLFLCFFLKELSIKSISQYLTIFACDSLNSLTFALWQKYIHFIKFLYSILEISICFFGMDSEAAGHNLSKHY